ncbi:hypothetical protein N658DRAFT_169674 [Parathielavia hyrcaniae]|uniref:Uncharacterized protein n=1 Tax=Parathielavia hyrcaniae TaxID=113614 RepID=A0AAN6T0C1_9PEZI|nr:hypothetical protein N658DRAFT_169674 [Parathielavia hyrcaniae]
MTREGSSRGYRWRMEKSRNGKEHLGRRGKKHLVRVRVASLLVPTETHLSDPHLASCITALRLHLHSISPDPTPASSVRVTDSASISEGKRHVACSWRRSGEELGLKRFLCNSDAQPARLRTGMLPSATVVVGSLIGIPTGEHPHGRHRRSVATALERRQ